jgi:hypothetical protein
MSFIPIAQVDATQGVACLMDNSAAYNKSIFRHAVTKGPVTPITFTDELLYRLSSFNSCHVFEDIDGLTHIQINWLYQDQAEANLYHCGIYEHPPEFVIFTEHMPTWLMDAIAHLDKLTMKRIVTNAVKRLYEAADPEYFHTNGIGGKIKWGFASEK